MSPMERQQLSSDQPGRGRWASVTLLLRKYSCLCAQTLFWNSLVFVLFHHGRGEALSSVDLPGNSWQPIVEFQNRDVGVWPAPHLHCALCGHWTGFQQHYVFLVWHPGWVEGSRRSRSSGHSSLICSSHWRHSVVSFQGCLLISRGQLPLTSREYPNSLLSSWVLWQES